ncbi:hypothetical protein EYF80_066636 [Liparis tanakae]|uniref:Uncharacterized protein n=1 Tax=Liparis tanakae TaxID=230148 RepID=A0A4Z2E394_9TELE|nr:hypothetical protein EYF80_066636 [Liparis tanakae]
MTSGGSTATAGLLPPTGPFRKEERGGDKGGSPNARHSCVVPLGPERRRCRSVCASSYAALLTPSGRSARWSGSPVTVAAARGRGGVVLRAHEEADLLRGRGGDVRRVEGRGGGGGGGRFGDLPVAAVQVQGGERRQEVVSVHRLVAAGRGRRRAQALPQAGLTAGESQGHGGGQRGGA